MPYPRMAVAPSKAVGDDGLVLPNCQDPELARWIFQVIKKSNEELQASIDARMQELLVPLGRERVWLKRPDQTRLKRQPRTQSTWRRSKSGEKESPTPSPATWEQSPQALVRSVTRQSSGSEVVPKSRIDWFMRQPIDIVAGVLIALSTFTVYLQLDWQGYLLNVQLGRDKSGQWPEAEVFFSVVDQLFCAIFVGELSLRLWYFGCGFFRDRLNVLDGVVVVLNFVEVVVLRHFGPSAGNLSFMRIFRYVKLVRTLRFIRAMQLCHQLRVLVRTILSSFVSLLWSMFVLCAFMLMAALFVCQSLQEFISDDSQTMEHRLWCNTNYGTASKALWTMFEITFSGGWPTWVRPLIEDVSPWYAGFFALYVGGVVFAVIRIITALFLKETLAVAATDAEMMMQLKHKETEAFAMKMGQVFIAADSSMDGMVSWEEFSELMDDPKHMTLLHNMELEPHEIKALFNLLDDGDGNVSFEEFLKGMVRLKGQARSLDVLAILHDSSKILMQVNAMGYIVDQLAEVFDIPDDPSDEQPEVPDKDHKEVHGSHVSNGTAVNTTIGTTHDGGPETGHPRISTHGDEASRWPPGGDLLCTGAHNNMALDADALLAGAT
mmetsp:Transcript_29060/g.73815  ORF Transcript_29060/g.73815 Transcript_29060/m.73815 type:complete len:606 (+) Transcript_29060:99-1916(+)